MSNLFRSGRTVMNQNPVKEISIRNLQPPQDAAEEEKPVSAGALFMERNRLLQEMEQRRQITDTEIKQRMEEAAADIESMQAAWANEKEQLQQQAYDEGFQAGFEDGRNKALAEMREMVEAANETTTLSYENATQYLINQERVILDIGIRSAEQIINKTIEDDDEAYLCLVRKGIKEAQEMKEIKLFVPTEHFKMVTTHRAELASIFPPETPFLIFVNEDFNATDCFIETNHGRIVVSVDDQLNELKEQLVKIMEDGV
ncbi:flagellar assembly protein FliH [Sporosarcina sp. P37]|uniref:flagellar assembly protein FliH n=1 Tax=unclassified Sporosarcina TaxID=2647733 RepID=UPI000A17DE03|nr:MULTISPECIES: flagellar assembly protein FliH [unclassified Sporosarcina]ARK25768.1 flagellar assembly protein FliH [Sporosarcina sp. P37]